MEASRSGLQGETKQSLSQTMLTAISMSAIATNGVVPGEWFVCVCVCVCVSVCVSVCLCVVWNRLSTYEYIVKQRHRQGTRGGSSKTPTRTPSVNIIQVRESSYS